MSDDYWLADSEARVLGPVKLAVVRDLALRGKLADVRAVSRDGKSFVALRDVPELVAVLQQPAGAGEAVHAMAEATGQIRNWLELVKGRPTHEVFRIPPGASSEAARAAFFALVQRYVPSRLPPDATEELRLACEDAFLTLAARMVDYERRPVGPSPVPQVAPAPPAPPTAAVVSWRGGMIHVRLGLKRGDARPFTGDPELTWKTDCLLVLSPEKVMVGTPAEVSLAFEGHVTQVNASGRVVAVRASYPLGFVVKLLGVDESQRSMIRTWVARSSR
jgi:hypothetical protein